MSTNAANDQRFTLPDWMQPHHQTIDWGLLLVVALSLLAALPFLTRPGLPRETDAELHVFRTAELMYSIREGAIYPRWAANFWYGYGYPFFNYYGSFTYYLATGFSLLTGSSVVDGAKFVFVLGQVIAGMGAFTFVRGRWNAPAGIVAGVAYVYSPYIVLIDPHMRGDMAEAFALGLLPCVLWAFDRVLVAGRGHHLAAAAGLLAALIFTHNLMALICFAVIFGWLVWLRFVVRECEARHWRLTWLTLALGIGLASFFWVPVALESGEVQLDRLTGPGHFDYQNHFLTLGELLAPAPALDLGAANPAYIFNLGLPACTLALAGCAALLMARQGTPPPRPPRAATLAEWRRRLTGETADETSPARRAPGRARDAAYFAVMGLALIFLMLPAAKFVWRTVPYMPVMQFPWRLLGAASFCLAVLAGVATRWLNRVPARVYPVALGALAAVPLLGSITMLYPPEWTPDFGPTTPKAYLDFELSGVALGTTAGGEFLPKTVIVPPGPQPGLIESYGRPGPVDIVNRATLPQDATVEVLRRGPTENRFLVQSRAAFKLRLYLFAFAGWQAEVDGERVEYEIGEPEGFIVIDAPAGVYEVRVFLGATPARTLAYALSLAALAGLAVVCVIAERGVRQSAPPADRLSRRSAMAVLAAGALLIGFKLLSDARPGALYMRSMPGEVPLPAENPYHVTFEENIELLAYDLPKTSVRPGGTLPVTLYWHATGPIDDNYQVFVHLAALGSDSPAAQSDKLNPGDYPTTRWTPERYIRDAHELALPDDLPPGQYQLLLGLYDLQASTRVLTAGPLPDDKAILPVFIEVSS